MEIYWVGVLWNSPLQPSISAPMHPNDSHFSLIKIFGNMESAGFSFLTHSLQSSYLCYKCLNDISSRKHLSTVEIIKEGNKISTKVEKIIFSHQISSCKVSFLTRSRKKEGFPDIYLIRSPWHFIWTISLYPCSSQPQSPIQGWFENVDLEQRHFAYICYQRSLPKVTRYFPDVQMCFLGISRL